MGKIAMPAQRRKREEKPSLGCAFETCSRSKTFTRGLAELYISINAAGSLYRMRKRKSHVMSAAGAVPDLIDIRDWRSSRGEFRSKFPETEHLV